MNFSIPDATTVEALLVVLERHPFGVALAAGLIAVAGYFWRTKK